ncbi:hypothetical protein FGRMN_10306 [Fusarium graminum]|nr:hypothetical protein FGRMN_10306 [Fusarium graminum]
MKFTKSPATILLVSIALVKAQLNRVKSPRFTRRNNDGVGTTVFEHALTGSSMEYVTNSGVCETTPGVNQYSGYLDYDQSMWFWFFEARNDPRKAPLALWLNGGPGCSSEIGIFQENGPCQFVENSTEPTLNPFSWNEYANMIYIDQPLGTGFSEGTHSINTTIAAAPYIWSFLQAFFDSFPQYESRDLGLFTESFGGHYGPEFAELLLDQNDNIQSGQIQGHEVNLVALGINSGWIDPAPQFKAYADYAYRNPYKKLINESTYEHFLGRYEEECAPLLGKCTAKTGQLEACYNASLVCNTIMYSDLIEQSGADFGVEDLRVTSETIDPSGTYVDYLNRKDIRDRIGARKTFEECDLTTFYSFGDTGDDARSYALTLARILDRNITTLLWAGDAERVDWSCSWPGVLEAANNINWQGQKRFNMLGSTNFTINGTVYGTHKSVDNLSWLKVHEAGHYVSYYQPEVALQVFKQTMQQKPIFST